MFNYISPIGKYLINTWYHLLFTTGLGVGLVISCFTKHSETWTKWLALCWQII